MLRVTLRGSGIRPAVLGSGETLFFGRAPHQSLPDTDPDLALHTTAVALPRCAAHVSRLLGELVIGEELVRLRWHGTTEAQLSSLFDAPGGARRVTLADGMAALLDEGENQLVVLRGRQLDDGDTADLQIVLDVGMTDAEPVPVRSRLEMLDADATVTAPAPTLAPETREWFVALALSEPWLTGTDDYPRPPSNREIYERIRGWRGHAWNLDRSQRVDDAIRAISRVAFGPRDDPFTSGAGRAQNVRFAIGRRAAEVRIVTVEDLERIESAGRTRPADDGPPPNRRTADR
jgi:hypothetical protein